MFKKNYTTKDMRKTNLLIIEIEYLNFTFSAYGQVVVLQTFIHSLSQCTYKGCY